MSLLLQFRMLFGFKIKNLRIKSDCKETSIISQGYDRMLATFNKETKNIIKTGEKLMCIITIEKRQKNGDTEIKEGMLV